MKQMFHEVTVASRRLITPGMVRITFAGDGLAAFKSTGIGDEYLRLFFPDARTGIRVLPSIDENGRWTYPEGPSKVRCSTYTVRRFDPEQRELDIDFVVHEGGLASEWAQGAQPGDTMVINSPRALYIPPGDMRWQVLVADATGLPALARILEQTPADIQSRVFIEVAEPAHEQDLPAHPLATVTWLHGGNGIAQSRLADIVRSVPLPATPGYIWVAGEQKVVRAIRKYVRNELKFPAERYELVGYWVQDEEQWNAGWEALDPAVRGKIEAAWASDRDREEIRDEVDATLEKFGL